MTAIVVSRAGAADLEVLAQLHVRAFPGFFLSDLGPAFLVRYYTAVLEYESGILLKVSIDGRLAGFASGFIRPSAFYALLVRRLHRLAPALLRAGIAKPRLLGRAARSGIRAARGSGHGYVPQSETPCELSSLAVDPDFQSRGLGGRLVDQFCALALGLGADSVYVATDAIDNDAVNAFYENAGFVLDKADSAVVGRRMNHWVREL